MNILGGLGLGSYLAASCDKIATFMMKQPSNKQPARVVSEQPKKLSDKALFNKLKQYEDEQNKKRELTP